MHAVPVLHEAGDSDTPALLCDRTQQLMAANGMHADRMKVCPSAVAREVSAVW